MTNTTYTVRTYNADGDSSPIRVVGTAATIDAARALVPNLSLPWQGDGEGVVEAYHESDAECCAGWEIVANA